MELHRLHRPEADGVDTARVVAVEVDVHGVPVLDRDHLRGLEVASRAAGAGEARSGARVRGCSGQQPQRERQEERDERTGTHTRDIGRRRLRMNTARMRMTRRCARRMTPGRTYAVAMSYTKKNLRDVEDVAVQHGLSERQEGRLAQRGPPPQQTGPNFLPGQPGRREGVAPHHPTAGGVYV